MGGYTKKCTHRRDLLWKTCFDLKIFIFVTFLNGKVSTYFVTTFHLIVSVEMYFIYPSPDILSVVPYFCLQRSFEMRELFILQRQNKRGVYITATKCTFSLFFLQIIRVKMKVNC